MDFRNGAFIEELNSVRRRIIPTPEISTNNSESSLDIRHPVNNGNGNGNGNDNDNDYINLETFTNNNNNNTGININYQGAETNRNTVYSPVQETNMDSISTYNLQRAFDKLSRTLELNNSVIELNKNTSCQTASLMILSCVSVVGLIVLNDYILLSYFI